VTQLHEFRPESSHPDIHRGVLYRLHEGATYGAWSRRDMPVNVIYATGRPNVAVERLTLLIRILKVPGSHLGPSDRLP
jgi:hypothetical protein